MKKPTPLFVTDYDFHNLPPGLDTFNHIQRWKKLYFNNRKRKVVRKIGLRLRMGETLNSNWWKYFVELYQDGKIVEQWQASPEFWDTAWRDDEGWKKSSYSGEDILIMKTAPEGA